MWNTLAGCKEVAEIDAMTEHMIHRHKLNTIKSRIDNRPPKIMAHLKRKAKKVLEEQKSQAEILYNNQLLLKKLEKIESNPSKTYTLGKNRSGNLNRLRIDELLRISDENNKILSRIQSAKSYYSSQKQQREYLYSKYLSIQLSENARRITRISTYNPSSMTQAIKSAKSCRPNTASEIYKSSCKSTRPVSAKQIKENL